MKTPKKHADLIKAWADGASIERFSHEQGRWVDESFPMFMEDLEYRIKQEFTVQKFVYMDTLGCVYITTPVNKEDVNVEFSFSLSGQLTNIRQIKK